MAYRLVDRAVDMGDMMSRGIVETFAQESDIANALSFIDVPSGVYQFNQETSLGGAAFRKINDGFTESTPTSERIVEVCYPMGGDADADRYMVDTQGEDVRARAVIGKTKKMAHVFDETFIKGDGLGDGFIGLQEKTADGQTIDAGGALSLTDHLDAAIDRTDNPSGIVMPKVLRRMIDKFFRGTGTSFRYESDERGRQIAFYNDLPILIADPNGHENVPLSGFSDEAGNSTSIYVVNMDPDADGVFAIQTRDPFVVDLGEVDDKPAYRTRIGWDIGLVKASPRAATRIRGITNLPVTV